ncbi:C40 family peptidase [Paraclostridium bifermentans]|uniref:CHAP domain-containing protein n=1 Tax=Paraclostridium bifermentans TaxID=1490 RepID=A0AA44DLP6_PARBF|nr:NlpC/P60 family protein [Paraclostridium bifermentans]MBN8047410.1 C40 family peptidase [Paraclostridium bifermentans]NME09987.1 CHAP domain-containing protein [Paraclostridium bifermentans]
MNKKIWGILGATVLSLSATTQLSFANEQESTSNMQVAAYSVRSQANANQIINFAKQQLGKPYVFGATGPGSFDCSGFVYYVFGNNGYNIPRTSVAGYWGASYITKISNPKPGDLIFFKNTYKNGPSHIGIVINDSQFIQASSSHGVCITDINNSYWKQHFLGYGRIINDDESQALYTAQAHVQDLGWLDSVSGDQVIGTTGQEKQLEAFKVSLDGNLKNATIQYQAHVQDIGWQDWKQNGEVAGTTGQAKRVEAVKMNLVNAPGYTIQYRAHVKDFGWLPWVGANEIAGTTGESRQLEAIQIRIIKN